MRALTAGSSGNVSHSENELVKSIELASSSERALGVRVAQTCKDLKSWAVEVESWEWPGTFAPPPAEERTAKRRRLLSEAGLSEQHTIDVQYRGKPHDGGFWGSLPSEVIIDHEARIEDIGEAMEELDLEGLKEHVRSAHLHARPGEVQGHSDHLASPPHRLGDVTALITATILQALPYVSWLNRLLSEWSIRLLVLRKVPGFLRALKDLDEALDSAWDEVDIQSQRDENVAGSLKSRMRVIRVTLENKVSMLGQLLDSMLDDLEGRAETLPDHWIEGLEKAESVYADWVVQSEKTVLQIEWVNSNRDDVQMSQYAHAVGRDYGFPMHTDDDSQLGDIDQGPVSPMEELFQNQAMPPASELEPSVSPIHRVESPVLGTPSFAFWNNDGPNMDINGRKPSAIEAHDTDYFDEIIADAQDQSQMEHDHARDVGVADGAGLIDQSSIRQEAVTEHPVTQEASSSSSEMSVTLPRHRKRYVPIEIGNYQKTAGKTSDLEEDLEQPFSVNREPPLPSLVEEVPPRLPNSVQSRKATFSGDLERKQSLQAAKSPVRSFERATSAFTNLFLRNSSQKVSRTNSRDSSRPSLRTKLTSGNDSARSSMSSRRESDQSFGRSKSFRNSLKRHNSGIEATEIIHNSPERGSSPKKDLSISPTQSPSRDKDEQSNSSPGRVGHGKGPMSRFDSPFMAQGTTDTWPLARKVGPEEMTSPREALQADYFERLFVDSLPLSPDQQSHPLKKEENPMERAFAFAMKPNGGREPIVEDGMLHHAMIATSNVRFQGDDSALSTPEVREASHVGYLKPREVRASPRRRHSLHIDGQTTQNQAPNASDFQPDTLGVAKPTLKEKRASVASIEYFARAQVRKHIEDAMGGALLLTWY